MNEKDVFDQADRLLGRFDFASQMAVKDEEHRERLRVLLLSFVEVMDSFDRLFSAMGEGREMTTEQARSYLKSCRSIARQLGQSLADAGVEPIPALGLQATAGRHVIVDVIDAPEVNEGVIVQEIFRGYEWNGELLRKPQVVVARGAEQTTREE